MNAVQFLKRDHQTIFRLFDKIKTSRDKDRAFMLFEEVKAELKVHTHLEEEIFYPAIEGIASLKNLLSKENEEDIELKHLLNEVNSKEAAQESEIVLRKTLDHIEKHILEEEEMFLQIEANLDGYALDEIGAELVAEAQDYRRFH